MTPDASSRSLTQVRIQILRWRTKWRPCKDVAVSQAFRFHFKCYSIFHIAVCQLLCSAFLYIYLKLLTRWITTLCLLNSLWRGNFRSNSNAPLDTGFYRQLLAFVAVLQLPRSSNYRSGVWQGGKLFHCLFAIFIDSVRNRIIFCGKGCHLASRCVSIILQVDDIHLLSPAVTGLRYIFNICVEKLRPLNMLINPSKVAFLHIGQAIGKQFALLLMMAWLFLGVIPADI